MKHAADSLLHGVMKGLEKDSAVSDSVHGHLQLPVLVEPGGHLSVVAAIELHWQVLANSTCRNEVNIAAAGLAEQGHVGGWCVIDGCNLAFPWNIRHVPLK